MVSIEYIIHAALQQDTVIARAFLRTCGVPVTSIPMPHAARVVSIEVAEELDHDLAWCFKNYDLPLEKRCQASH